MVQLALLLAPHLDGFEAAGDALPLPRGMTIAKCADNGQLQLVLADAYARRLRRVFGYVGEVKLSSGEGTVTPAQLQVIVRYAMIE